MTRVHYYAREELFGTIIQTTYCGGHLLNVSTPRNLGLMIGRLYRTRQAQLLPHAPAGMWDWEHNPDFSSSSLAKMGLNYYIRPFFPDEDAEFLEAFHQSRSS